MYNLNSDFTINNCRKHYCCNINWGNKYLHWKKLPKFVLNVVPLEKKIGLFSG